MPARHDQRDFRISDGNTEDWRKSTLKHSTFRSKPHLIMTRKLHAEAAEEHAIGTIPSTLAVVNNNLVFSLIL